MTTYRHPMLEEKEAYVETAFDTVAERYDLMNRVITLGGFDQLHQIFKPYTGFTSGMRVLDLACGTGDISLISAEQVYPRGEVIGIDISMGMVEVGRRRVANGPYSEVVTLQKGSAMEIPFPDNSFDGVTIGFAMRNVNSVAQVLKEGFRVLKPGGRFISLDAARPKNPVNRLGHTLIFKVFTPLMDRIVLRLKDNASVKPYTYMSHSLDNHPDVNEIERMFEATGFVYTGHVTFAAETTSVHWGHKPAVKASA